MTRELKNANITHVSYVDKGANQKKFFMLKSEGSNDTSTPQEVQEMIQAKIKPIMERVDNLEKARIQKSMWNNLFKAEGHLFK